MKKAKPEEKQVVTLDNADLSNIEPITRSIVEEGRAAARSILSGDSARTAGELLVNRIRPARKRLKSIFEGPIKKAREALESIRGAYKNLDDPLADADRAIQDGLLRYQQKVERDRRIEEARLAAKAREIAEEQQRKEAEALRKAGEEEAAREVEAEVLPAPVVTWDAPAIPKVEGLQQRENWVGEVTDLKALVRAVAAGTVPIEAIEPNMKVIHAQAKSLHGAFKWPGCRAYDKGTIAVTAA